MAYDRYDTRRDRDWRGPESDRGRREERGFFERAGDEIASWFGDDDDRGRHRDDRMSRDRGWSREEHGWGGDPNYDRGRHDYRGSNRDMDRGRFDEDRSSSRPMNWTSSNRDYRSGIDRGGWGGGSSGPDRGFGGERGYRPMTGDYGRSSGEGRSQDWGFGDRGSDRSERGWNTSFAGSNRGHDRHYEEWRQRQLHELDRDYEDYRREHQQRFESDFGSWRQKRQQKRGLLGQIREHMDVVGSDGQSIGKVDKVHGDHIVLTKSDSDDNRHHSIKCTMIDSVEGDQVRLDVPAEEAKSHWQEIDSDRSVFGRDNDRDGDHGEVSLERSFSGTYR